MRLGSRGPVASGSGGTPAHGCGAGGRWTGGWWGPGAPVVRATRTVAPSAAWVVLRRPMPQPLGGPGVPVWALSGNQVPHLSWRAPRPAATAANLPLRTSEAAQSGAGRPARQLSQNTPAPAACCLRTTPAELPWVTASAGSQTESSRAHSVEGRCCGPCASQTHARLGGVCPGLCLQAKCDGGTKVPRGKDLACRCCAGSMLGPGTRWVKLRCTPCFLVHAAHPCRI